MRIKRLIRPNLHLNIENSGPMRGEGRFKMQFQSFAQVGKGILLAGTLTGDIHLQALRNHPLTFMPDSGNLAQRLILLA